MALVLYCAQCGAGVPAVGAVPPVCPLCDRAALWSTHPPVPACIHCDNDRDIERKGTEYFCPCCARTWPAPSKNDQRMLKSLRIQPG